MGVLRVPGQAVEVLLLNWKNRNRLKNEGRYIISKRKITDTDPSFRENEPKHPEHQNMYLPDLRSAAFAERSGVIVA